MSNYLCVFILMKNVCAFIPIILFMVKKYNFYLVLMHMHLFL